MPRIGASKRLTSDELADMFFAQKGPSMHRLARIEEHTDMPGAEVIRAAARRHAEDWARETFPGLPVPELRSEDLDGDPDEDEDD